ncbi:hypothetical protein BU23DRAFT_571316 [Bimuria novae-zelandiae CBS 107.79]|uniref:Uncharacterized protein n=1 Tax=Bimuria novae-zelandiae CBS 107.79 TaxID=1447943 RepID=A0A6A5UXS4_9PLEO|nr:hypothetical protein BU23DRAFT_571316 [Bimuria novae-zelandiae CBS 107.79]
MQLTAALTTFLLGTSTATIILGNAKYSNGNKDTAVWIQGEDPCAYTFLGHGSPCDFGPFALPNGSTYRFAGCDVPGQRFVLENGDGSFNSEARFNEVNGLVNCQNGAGSE